MWHYCLTLLKLSLAFHLSYLLSLCAGFCSWVAGNKEFLQFILLSTTNGAQLTEQLTLKTILTDVSIKPFSFRCHILHHNAWHHTSGVTRTCQDDWTRSVFSNTDGSPEQLQCFDLLALTLIKPLLMIPVSPKILPDQNGSFLLCWYKRELGSLVLSSV